MASWCCQCAVKKQRVSGGETILVPGLELKELQCEVRLEECFDAEMRKRGDFHLKIKTLLHTLYLTDNNYKTTALNHMAQV